tara:strand:+ start:283 stop:585 length:303 start_codon:yes stop_codon:yes gene_type:complete
MKIPYRFSEDKIVKSLQDYLDGTYSGHYTNEDKKEIQVIDVWESMGSLDSTARDNALKYLLRFGKKEGKNPKDLYKAMHYIILMLYCLKKEATDATASGE